MSFTTEEIWPYLPKVDSREESVHLAHFPAAANILGDGAAERDEKQHEDWTKLRNIRDNVLKVLEDSRNSKLIGTGLEAQIIIRSSGDLYSLLNRYESILRYLFIVSSVSLEEGTGNTATGATCAVKKAEGQKCERCWNYSTHVGENPNYPTVCERCSAVLREI